jgi:hypothetical protein
MTTINSHWKIIAKIKPEYIQPLSYFITYKTWKEPLPSFIESWHLYFKSIGAYQYDTDYHYHYTPPFGNESKWGKICQLTDDVFITCGCIPNTDLQIQRFISNILLPISCEVIECLTYRDNTDNIQSYTDAELHSMYFRDIVC